MSPLSSYSKLLARSRPIMVVAVLCGVILAVSALFIAGSGDGSYFLVGLYSAPIGILAYLMDVVKMVVAEPPQFVATLLGLTILFVGIPLLWLLAGFLGTIPGNTKRRGCLGVFLIAHYAGAIFLLSQNEPYGNWRRLHEQWGLVSCKVIIILSLMIYLIGQLWLWRQLLRK